ncbi:MAG: LD-carboxypeptidase, partial [Deltaproteobacteria bacterium]|nr:LD-carboxypeptidase [Deltaproteobacteria bacterium]
RPGDAVAIAAPAGPVREARFARGLELLGAHFPLRIADDVRRATGFLAGADARRIEEWNGYLRDPDVRAIVIARGGYGIMRILPHLDAAALAADPKPIVGFSDATAMLSWAARAGVRGIHAAVVTQLSEIAAEDVAALIRMLTDPEPLGRLPWPLTAIGAHGDDVRRGRLVPANLAMLTHLLGTPWQLETRDAIVALEDVGEKPYALDRYLTHVGLAGGLAGASAVVLGDLIRCTEVPLAAGAIDDPGPAIAVVDERLRAFGLAGVAGAPFGHGSRNAPLPWGARAELDLAAGALAILDGAVA